MNKYIKSKSTINNLKLSTKTMSLNLSVVIGASVQRGLVDSHVTFARSVIGQLSKEGVLNVGLEEALEMFDFRNEVWPRKQNARRNYLLGQQNQLLQKEPVNHPWLFPAAGRLWATGAKRFASTTGYTLSVRMGK